MLNLNIYNPEESRELIRDSSTPDLAVNEDGIPVQHPYIYDPQKKEQIDSLSDQYAAQVRENAIEGFLRGWPEFIRSFLTRLLLDTEDARMYLLDKTREKIEDAIRRRDLIVAENTDTQKIIGLAKTTVIDQRFTPSFNQIEFAVVDKDHRRKGVYKRLDQAAQDYFKGVNPEGIGLTMTRNADVSQHRLNQGWELVKDLSAFPDHLAFGMLQMIKKGWEYYIEPQNK